MTVRGRRPRGRRLVGGARLDELRLKALEGRLEADLALGRAGELVPELEVLVAEHPFREHLRAQLMLALYRAGRQAEALAAYRQARQTLVAELGYRAGRAAAGSSTGGCSRRTPRSPAAVLPLLAPPRREKSGRSSPSCLADLVDFTATAERARPGGHSRLSKAVLRPHSLRARALRRQGREVHRRRGDGALRRSGCPRGRSRASGARGAGHPRLACRAERPQQVRIAVATGEAHVTFGELEHGRGADSRGRCRQHGGPAAGAAPETASSSASRRSVPRARDRVPGSWGPSRQRGRARPSGPGRRSACWRSPAPILRGTLAPSSVVSASSPPCTSGLPGPPPTLASARHDSRRPRHRQDAPGLRAATSATGADKPGWRQGRSLPYGEGVGFWALGEMVKAEAGILESDQRRRPTPSSKRQSDGRRRSGRGRGIATYLGALIGLARRGARQRRPPRRDVRGLGAFPRVARGRAPARAGLRGPALGRRCSPRFRRRARRPRQRRAAPRRGDGATRAARAPTRLGRRQGGALTISLPPLSESDTTRSSLLCWSASHVDTETHEALLARIGGNPLYAEQFCRMLLEHGRLEELPKASTASSRRAWST